MNTGMVRLNITLPLSISKELNQFSGPRKRSKFIAEAITYRINQLKKKKMEGLLAEGYKATKDETLEIAKAFEVIDLGTWDEY